MSNTMLLCRKELRDFIRSRNTVLLVCYLTAIMVISVVVSAAAFRVKLADYNHYIAALKTAGGVLPTQPQLFPLQLLRGSIEYLELIGALLAIILGYGIIAKEKQRGTLQLLFSRPIRGRELAGGKLLALAIIWLVALLFIFLVTVGSLVLIGKAPLHTIDILRLTVTLALAWVYVLFWSYLAMGLAALSKQLTAALVLALVLWLVVVLILPQIGDTMDPDNQVPGGLFKSLQVDKAHENLVISHFTGYETIRNYVEVSSITKQLERPTFAYLGMNDTYNQKSLGFVSIQMWPNMLGLLLSGIGATVLAILSCSKRNLLRKE